MTRIVVPKTGLSQEREIMVKGSSVLDMLKWKDFPAGPVVKALRSNARDVASIPGQGLLFKHILKKFF